MRTIYFDYNATTPLDPAVREAMLPFLGEVWGNPSSIHHVGRTARAWLDEAHDRTAKVLGCKPSEIIFTSGGTESNALAVFGTARLLKPKGRHIITSAIEHHAVLSGCEYLAKKEGFELSILPVDHEGFVAPEDLKRAIRKDTILVSVMAANNEIGTIQPVADLGRICLEHGVVFHTDAVQWFGKETFSNIQQFNADLVSVCSHKFHGPKGAGVLFIRSPLQPDPILFGGGHENDRRAGTENLAAIAGLVSALEMFVQKPVFDRFLLDPLAARLRNLLRLIPDVRVLGPRSGCLTNTIAFTVKAVDGIALLAALDLEGVCASSGAACSAGSLEPSHVVAALGLDDAEAKSLVRFSLGRETTLEEVELVEAMLPKLLAQLRSV